MADFLDKFREGLGKGMSTLGTKSKELPIRTELSHRYRTWSGKRKTI